MQYLVLPYKLGARNKVEAQQAQACMTEHMPQTRHLRCKTWTIVSFGVDTEYMRSISRGGCHRAERSRLNQIWICKCFSRAEPLPAGTGKI